MTTEKYTSKVNNANANPKNNSLKCTIPQQVAVALDITHEDSIKWIIKKENESITITVEKLVL